MVLRWAGNALCLWRPWMFERQLSIFSMFYHKATKKEAMSLRQNLTEILEWGDMTMSDERSSHLMFSVFT